MTKPEQAGPPALATNEYPAPDPDEREAMLGWLAYLRRAVIRKVEGLDEEQARWTPGGALIPLLGVVNHLTMMEWRWIDGALLGQETSRDEAEFRPGAGLTVPAALAAYRERAAATDAAVRAHPLTTPCQRGDGPAADLRWVLLHIIHETAQHGGHADATRELLDGATGE
jgi:uncharacterized damage-inducible protein DinB